MTPVMIASSVQAESSLHLSYPPDNHETFADRIFIIGTANPNQPVVINGESIYRSPAGHFAPSVPLEIGENVIDVQVGDRRVQRRVIRLSRTPNFPEDGFGFAEGSLAPAVDITRQVGELVCFSALAPGADFNASVSLGGRQIPLLPETNGSELPGNAAVLTGENQPQTAMATRYEGCHRFETTGRLGQPVFELRRGDRRLRETASGAVEIRPAPVSPLSVARIINREAISRTGPGTSYSRLTPIPEGVQAAITGSEGDWLRLDYGVWVHRGEVEVQEAGQPPQGVIRSISSRQQGDRTEIRFPLNRRVPPQVQQEGRRFRLILHNTTAQTDLIAFNANPAIRSMTWQQLEGDRVEYTFEMTSPQQWGYDLRYDNTTLVLSLRHPPEINPSQPLSGTTIFIDPGHGGPEDFGATSPTGIREKEPALTVSLLLRDELERRGARVVLSRETDIDVGLRERMDMIQKAEPTLALSIHYNALPDSGDAENTAGIGTFWYHPQAEELAIFLYRHLVEDLNRPEYGVFWANFALTRPQIAPSVLLELGFMINPDEYEWIMDEQEQQRLAVSLAQGIEAWLAQQP
ncbi:N-acetylmuramoyl-L-alanine amidase [Geitlerinema sp. P-1104]|uniref:N-acetylmuramoyl-L-alanine amidase n=1 Tax=Geitlerinema sp. P-1104 TaxID=2546230 RepID=UPI00336BE966